MLVVFGVWQTFFKVSKILEQVLKNFEKFQNQKSDLIFSERDNILR